MAIKATDDISKPVEQIDRSGDSKIDAKRAA